MSHEEKAEPKLVGYVYEFTTLLGEGTQLKITGNLALDAEVADMNAQFDRISSVFYRLGAKQKIEKKKGEIAADKAMINAIKEDLKQLDVDAATKYKGRNLPTAEQNSRESMVRNVRHLEGRLAQFQEELKALEEDAK